MPMILYGVLLNIELVCDIIISLKVSLPLEGKVSALADG